MGNQSNKVETHMAMKFSPILPYVPTKMSPSQITLPIISPYPPPLPSAKSVPVLWRNGSVALSFIVLPQPFGNTHNHNESSLQLSSQKSLLCRKG